jgi:ATP-dependent helicase/nuclease subunit B
MTDRGMGAGAPRVYTIAAGVPFAEALARGLIDGAAGAHELARCTILLPTRRSVRALRDAFLRQSGGTPMLLPVMRPVGDIDEDDLAMVEAGVTPHGGEAATLGEPPAVAPLTRQLLLARLILKWAEGHLSAPRDAAQASRLAADLASLIDQVQTERLTFDGLAGLVPGDYAEHWQETLGFLRIVTETWPAVLAERGAIDPAERRNRLLAAQAEAWASAPPGHPVIAAGSTGSIPATADLLAVVARLPAGAVVLPGLDQELDDTAWDAIDATHPQFTMKQLLERIRVDRREVETWPGSEPPPAAQARARLLSEVMRPAETSEQWRASRGIWRSPVEGLTRITCATPRQESATIALLMREALETPGRTAALVTPDRNLARRVIADLGRWDIAVDDSAGTPLGKTVPAAFLRLIAGMAAGNVTPLALLAALKHPLSSGGLARPAFLRLVRKLEIETLRGPRTASGFTGVIHAIPPVFKDLHAWLERLQSAAAPLTEAVARPSVELSTIVRAHIAFAEWLAATDQGPGIARLWAGEAGEALAAFIDELASSAGELPPIAGPSYPALFERLMAGRAVRARHGLHGRLFIWGPLEARLQQADLLILGGLNEDTWPPTPDTDPWLSRPMRASFGLPAPERRIGLSAHDFVQGAAAPEVVLIRSAKVEGSPTVASRWLLRLGALIGEPGGAEAERAGSLLSWHRQMDAPAAPVPAAPPSFAPPLAARPRTLSVSDIESLVRDPYAVFAKRILGLRPLDAIEADPGAAQRGTLIHEALDSFTAAYPDELPHDALDRLREHGRKAFGETLTRPGVWAFWWARFDQIAAWFIDHERARRKTIKLVAGEAAGTLSLEAPGGTFVLTARADRIDRLPSGALAIIDYKTGQIPAKAEVERGISPQLPLEALIAEAGGFEGVSAAAVEALAYWQLMGGRDGGKERDASDDAARSIDEARDGLARLIAAFDDETTPYLARPRPGAQPNFSDYDHLARYLEWGIAERRR